MFSFLAFCLHLLQLLPATSQPADLSLTKTIAEQNAELVDDLLFPHHDFTSECNVEGHSYSSEFTFLAGLGRGFIHAEPHRVFFEYYFPAQHWVGFAAADQSIVGEVDACTSCYFTHYYQEQEAQPISASSSNESVSNLYPLCIEECLDDTIFVATVNSDEGNANNWNMIEFQIAAQQSRKMDKTMYRIPKFDEILELWGSSAFPDRESAHFEAEVYTVGAGESAKEYIHAKFWRRYDFDAEDKWKMFVKSPEADAQGLYHADMLCFISIASFYGGEYPYDDDALEGLLPGFYIDTQRLANIHCLKLKDIKDDCGQDWSFLDWTQDEGEVYAE